MHHWRIGAYIVTGDAVQIQHGEPVVKADQMQTVIQGDHGLMTLHECQSVHGGSQPVQLSDIAEADLHKVHLVLAHHPVPTRASREQIQDQTVFS